ncbi:type IX secretion system sortase PorU [candidate division KSB1 bacterium]|nr:type IX secretion system sortase PorU [candidate division KSB1 bacterium]
MRKLYYFLFCSFLVFTIPATAEKSPDIVVLPGENSVDISFSPQDWRQENKTIDSKKYTTFTFTGSSLSGEPGSPKIPSRVVTVGIPSSGDVSLVITESDFTTISDVYITPTAGVQRRGKTLIKVQHEDEKFYTRQSFYPQQLVTMEPPTFFRSQRVVRLIFYPLLYNAAANKVQQYNKISVRLFLSGTNSGQILKTSQKDESLYEQLLINYRQACRWRIARPELAKKATAAFPGENWYKVIISGNGQGGKEGIYKIDTERLNSAGIPVSSIDPATIQLFYNGGRILDPDVLASRPDSLIEIPIELVDGGDGRLGGSDYFLFYGESLEGKIYKPAPFDTVMGDIKHYINPYSFENVFWLTFGQKQGKRIQSMPSEDGQLLSPEASFRDLVFLEEERYNILNSGIDWFGFELASDKSSYSHVFQMPGAIPSSDADVRINMAAATGGTHNFDFYLNGFNIGTESQSGSYNGYTLRTLEFSAEGIMEDGDNTLQVDYNMTSEFSFAYIDWIEIEYDRRFKAANDQLIFRAPLKSGPAKYQISGFSRNDLLVYDITDLTQMKKITGTSINNGTLSFTAQAQTGNLRRYIALSPGAFRTVNRIEKDEESDLRRDRDVDYIIITHDDFYQNAKELETLRESRPEPDRLETEVVKISDVFDEFACGLYDPTAIRDFLVYAQSKWGAPGYVLLFGDGHYDYKDIQKYGTANLIPPYETDDRYDNSTRTTDDWYTYTRGTSAGMQMAIGRLPVQSVEEAKSMVEKIVTYESNPEFGEWRKTITIVADDELAQVGTENETIHTSQAETLAENYTPEEFNISKIYLVEYPVVRTASVSGRRKPLATDALIEQINRGTLVLNFIGHGNDELWTHEQVLNGPTDFERIQNGNRMALWVAATCEFAHWDQPDNQSLAEQILTVGGRGAVAMISSARLAYSSPNADFNYSFFSYLFNNFDSTGLTQRFGDAVMLAKRASNDRTNSEKFGVFGDPAMRLGAPRYKAVIEKITPDSIQALRRISLSGHVKKDGVFWNTFNGNVLVRVLDSKKRKSYVTDKNSTINYYLPGNSIFRGVVDVTDGRFDVEFIVPKDISYGGTDGKVSIYFWDDKNEGLGQRGGLVVGGTAVDLVDHEGPQLKIHFGDEKFSAGDYTPDDPLLHVEITDSLSGVNIAGDIGHQITMAMDDDYVNSRDITEYFQYNKGSYVSGMLKYPMYSLSEGTHTIQIKAWDNSNNSAITETFFTVVTEKELTIRNLLTWPNPMTEDTRFSYELSQDAQVLLKIFTVGGRLVRDFSPVFGNVGFNVYPGKWDGTDAEGDRLANGVYLYKLTARKQVDGENKSVEKIGKLVIAR